jgi:hypothetical protein
MNATPPEALAAYIGPVEGSTIAQESAPQWYPGGFPSTCEVASFCLDEKVEGFPTTKIAEVATPNKDVGTALRRTSITSWAKKQTALRAAPPSTIAQESAPQWYPGGFTGKASTCEVAKFCLDEGVPTTKTAEVGTPNKDFGTALRATPQRQVPAVMVLNPAPIEASRTRDTNDFETTPKLLNQIGESASKVGQQCATVALAAALMNATPPEALAAYIGPVEGSTMIAQESAPNWYPGGFPSTCEVASFCLDEGVGGVPTTKIAEAATPNKDVGTALREFFTPDPNRPRSVQPDPPFPQETVWVSSYWGA